MTLSDGDRSGNTWVLSGAHVTCHAPLLLPSSSVGHLRPLDRRSRTLLTGLSSLPEAVAALFLARHSHPSFVTIFFAPRL